MRTLAQQSEAQWQGCIFFMVGPYTTQNTPSVYSILAKIYLELLYHVLSPTQLDRKLVFL